MNNCRLASLLAAAGLAQAAVAQCPPAPPQNVNASKAGYCGSVYITWNEVSGASEYFVYRNTSNNWADSSLVGSALFGTTHLTDITALQDRSYYYWVTAKRNLCLPGSGTSPPGGPDTGWRDQDPMAPTDVRASDGTNCGGVLVSWNQPAPSYGGIPTGHTIFRNTIDLYLTSTQVGTAPGSWGGYFLDTTAEPGTTYYYWVRADGQCGTAASSSDSGTVAVTPNPPNDFCETAQLIEPGTYVGSTGCATNDGSATCAVAGSSSPDVWYAFIPPVNGSLHADTCGASGSFNTVLSVRAGACPGTELACNDDSCGNQSSLDVPVNAGQIYRIRVAGRGSLDFGSFVLHVGFTPAAGACYANCDNSTVAPALNVLDFSCFLNKFASGDPYANCDASTTPPVLNVVDFSCFLNAFAAGCS